MQTDGIFLIDNGYLLIIYIKQNINKKLLHSILGVKDLTELTSPILEDNVLVDPDNIKQALMNIIDYIRSTKALFQNLIFVFEGTEGERMYLKIN